MDKTKINNLIETISASLELLKKALDDNKPMSIDDHRTVTIGKQTWLAENLKIDDGGDGIYFNKENSEYYYTWDAAMRIANSILGWHLPSLDEWTSLAKATGDFDNAGKYLKSTTGWGNDGNGTDKCGFAMFPAGHQDKGFIYRLGKHAIFWASTEYSSTYAYHIYFNTGMSMHSSYCGKNADTYSVRLVKDS